MEIVQAMIPQQWIPIKRKTAVAVSNCGVHNGENDMGVILLSSNRWSWLWWRSNGFCISPINVCEWRLWPSPYGHPVPVAENIHGPGLRVLRCCSCGYRPESGSRHLTLSTHPEKTTGTDGRESATRRSDKLVSVQTLFPPLPPFPTKPMGCLPTFSRKDERGKGVWSHHNENWVS